MSDLVERVARAFCKHVDDWIEARIDDREMGERLVAAMQTDAAPALKPAVEVWRECRAAWGSGPDDLKGPNGFKLGNIEAASAVIEADRAAIIAA